MSQVGETFQNLNAGMNGGVHPAFIGAENYAKGINITCRGGVIRTRPPFQEITFASGNDAMVHNLEYGKFQGMYPYQYQDTQYIAFAFSGKVYILNPMTQTITELTAVAGDMDATVARLYFCQVEDYLVVQDGLNRALISLNTAATKSAVNQVPIGTIMAYGQGRLFLKTATSQFLAGDINLPATPANVLNFTETQYLAGGGAFFTPSWMGGITGMTFCQQFGSANGFGPLLVLCKQGIASYDVATARLFWQDNPIMRIEAGGNGNVSHLGMVKLDDDLVFRTWGGIQDFSLAVGQVQNKQRITNLNMEVLPFVDGEDEDLLPYTSACRFDNRVLYTVQGETVSAMNSDGRGGYVTLEDYRFKGLVSLDFAPMDGISSLGQVVKPSYDGVWTGVYPMGVCSGIFNYTERCFMFGKDNDGKNHLFEILKYPGHDNGDVPITCRLYTRMIPFVLFTGNRPSQIPQQLKKLQDAWIWISELRDRVQFQLWARADRCFDFFKVSEMCINAPLVDPVTGAAGNVQCSAKTKWPELHADNCQVANGRPADTGFEFELCIEWTGMAELSRMLFTAEASGEAPEPQCNCAGEVLTGTQRSDYDFDTYTAPVVASQGSLPIASGGSGTGAITAPIVSGNGSQTSPYVMTGVYDTVFHASDAALGANAEVDDWVTTTIARFQIPYGPGFGAQTFQILDPAIQFLAPVTGGLGTAASPWIVGGGPYPSYGEANGIAFLSVRWPKSTTTYGLWVPDPTYGLTGYPYFKALIYHADGTQSLATFSGWDVRSYLAGVSFGQLYEACSSSKNPGCGTVSDPWQFKSSGTYYGLDDWENFATLADMQYRIQRCYILEYCNPTISTWPTIGNYFRAKIATVVTTIQVP